MKRTKLMEYRGKRSQAEMAKLYDVSQQSWCKWENGENKPSVVLMKKLEMDSGIPMESLFFDVFNKKNLLNTSSSTHIVP